jgi:transposase
VAYNFLACDRDQAFLLPPDLRDWLPADHLAWFVLDVVDHLELGPFLAAYRADGHGRAAYDPKMLLGVLLYAYCTGIRSSRQIERRCHEDIAFRVLAANAAAAANRTHANLTERVTELLEQAAAADRAEDTSTARHVVSGCHGPWPPGSSG